MVKRCVTFVAALLMFVFSILLMSPMGIFPSRNKRRSDPYLDVPLFWFSKQDTPYTLREAAMNVGCFGGIGSGKSSSLKTIACAFLRAQMGGLVLCAKPEEARNWLKYCEQTGRLGDVIHITADGEWTFNWIEHEQKNSHLGAGSVENITAMIITAMESMNRDAVNGSGDSYWINSAKQMIRNACQLLQSAGEAITLANIHRVIMEAPQSVEQAESADWQSRSYTAQLCQMADEREKTDDDAHDLGVGLTYFLREFAALSDRTRSSIVSTFTSIVDPLLRGYARRILGTTTTFTPEMIFRDRAVVIVDFPIQIYHESGRLIAHIIKYAFQRSVLARNVEEYPEVCFQFIDEYQHFIASTDESFFSTGRSARVASVVITQNISSYVAVLGAAAKDKVNSLLANLQTYILFSNTDSATNLWSANTITQGETEEVSVTIGADGKPSISTTRREKYKVRPEAFTRLQRGGPPNFTAQAVVFSAGRTFVQTNDCYTLVSFPQD